MALQIDITDQKGVKARYHRIKALTLETNTIKVTMRSYVNQTTRDAEKKSIETNRLAAEYDQESEAIRSRLDSLSAQVTPEGKGDADVIAEIIDLSGQVNDRAVSTDRPQYQMVTDKYYDEVEVEIGTPDSTDLTNIYEALATTDRYSGAQNA